MDLAPLFPEISVAVLALIVLGIDWVLPKTQKQALGYVAIFGLALIFVAVHFAYHLHMLPDAENLYIALPNGASFFQGFVFDSFSLFFKELFIVIGLLVFVFSIFFFEEKRENVGEYYALLLFVLLGAFFLVSAADLLTFFVSYELMSLPLYILCGFVKHDSKSGESGLKYYLTGAVTSGILLYGMSLLYAASGTTDLRHLAFQQPIAMLGLIFVLSALAFKIAAVPFHMWAPDVYEGAPTPVVTVLAIIPKVAVVGLLMRIFLSNMVEPGTFWTWIFAVLGALSMTIGNLMALHQQNLKRLFAYSGISQIGYILVGLAAVQPISIMHPSLQPAYQAVLFYLVAYAFSEVVTFGVVSYLSRQGYETVNSCKGLAAKFPELALILLLAILSLAGIPPLVGFVGKFYLFVAAFSRKLYWLVALAFVNSVVSLFYYLRIAKAMYLEESADEKKLLRLSMPMQTALWVGCVMVVAIGVFPKIILDLTQNALSKFLIGY